MALEGLEGTGVAAAPTTSLAARLAWGTLIFCLVFTVLSATLRAWVAEQTQRSAMAAELSQIDQVFQRTLAKAIWEMDRETLKTQLDSVTSVASVGRVAVTIRQAGRAAEVLERRREGWIASPSLPALQRELVVEPYPGAREVVGSLALDGEARELQSRLHAAIVEIVITQVVQSLLLAGLVTWMFNRSVTVHVRRIAQHLGRLTPQTLEQPLNLQRAPKRRDELTLLASGVNQLQGSLYAYLERQRGDERELAAHRDRLAELVDQRTQALQAANQKLEALSRSDSLTGLPNRRHFDEAAAAEFRRALRMHQPLSLLLCDVDHFKRYNDHYGHAAGDRALQQLAQVMQLCFGRAGELAARIGGEEFAVLLPNCDLACALDGAKRLHEALAAQALPHAASDVSEHLTLSIGAAEFDAATMDAFDSLYHLADQALYRAKGAGRNQAAA
jgi:diguanylate cyclase (GGDEF)-like protein